MKLLSFFQRLAVYCIKYCINQINKLLVLTYIINHSETILYCNFENDILIGLNPRLSYNLLRMLFKIVSDTHYYSLFHNFYQCKATYSLFYIIGSLVSFNLFFSNGNVFVNP